MSNAENMKVDLEELKKQEREAIIESGKYAHLEILVQKDSKEPCAIFSANHCSSEEIAKLLCTMDLIKEAIAKKDPAAFFMYKMNFFNAEAEAIVTKGKETIGKIELENNKKENGGK